ncbi:MAG: (2Fe-2S)-binding protein [Bdellovibrionales bacterium]|nr:(2Fe-2S)-binding protein [Bdellovibrionales bacterium]
MAKVSFNSKKSLLNNQPIEVQKDESLMFELLRAGLPVASSCHGDGVCAKCRVTILKGLENVLPESPLEASLRERNNLKENERLSCQMKLTGDIEIDTNYW